MMNTKKLGGALALTLVVAAAPAVFAVTNRDAFSQEFARFDTNRDGRISRSEFPFDAAAFNRLDRNRDGLISQSEAQTAVNDPNLQRQELQRLDRNGDGIISRGEWTGDAATFDRLDRNRDGVLSQADRGTFNDGATRRGKGKRFHGLDTNNDGRITRGEWRGNDQSFRQHDRNGDGVISGSELKSKAKGKNKEKDRD